MGKSNKNARKALENIYGKSDMFVDAKIEEQVDEINKTKKKRIKTYREYKQHYKYTKSKEKSLEKTLSYHHLRHRSDCGDSSVENGALLSALPHSYLHSLPRDDEEIINNMLREYKAGFDVHCVSLEVTDKGLEIEPLQETEETIELPPEIENGIIELEFNSPEEQAQYEQYKKKKIAEKYKKFGVETLEQKWKREQKELLEDLEMEFNERNRGGYGR